MWDDEGSIKVEEVAELEAGASSLASDHRWTGNGVQPPTTATATAPATSGSHSFSPSPLVSERIVDEETLDDEDSLAGQTGAGMLGSDSERSSGQPTAAPGTLGPFHPGNMGSRGVEGASGLRDMYSSVVIDEVTGSYNLS